MAVCDAPVSDSRPRPALHAGLWRDPRGRGCPADPSPAEESQSQRGCRAVRPLYERGVSQSRPSPSAKGTCVSSWARTSTTTIVSETTRDTRQPAPATTVTVGEPGRRRSAAGVSGRIAQFLPPGGRMRGRPIKRTLRGSRVAALTCRRAPTGCRKTPSQNVPSRVPGGPHARPWAPGGTR